MMEIATILVMCGVFAVLTVVAITAALRSARVNDVIGEVFSPWLQDPFGASGAAEIARAPTPEAGEPAGRATAGKRRASLRR